MGTNLLNKLTEIEVRNAELRAKPYKLTDGNGMHLLVTSDGKKYWRLQYRELGKQKLLALGVYPTVTLKEAREKCRTAKKLLANGIDPSNDRKERKRSKLEVANNTFEAVAMEWYTKQLRKWRTSTKTKVLWILERILFPYLGKQPIANITAKELLAALRKTEDRGKYETVRKANSVAGQVFRYAIATSRATNDPAPHLRGALIHPKETHHASITDPKEVGQLLLAMDDFKGSFVVKCALYFSPLVFQRPGEVRNIEWSEIDFEKREWSIAAHKMKMDNPHIVPLSKQAIKILRDIQPLTGRGKYVFPSARGQGRPMSDGAVRIALRAIGYTNEQITPHGFRAMARTILDEILGVRVDIIEQQLAHTVKDTNGTAYNRTKHLPARHEMMQKWADYLDELHAVARGSEI